MNHQMKVIRMSMKKNYKKERYIIQKQQKMLAINGSVLYWLKMDQKLLWALVSKFLHQRLLISPKR